MRWIKEYWNLLWRSVAVGVWGRRGVLRRRGGERGKLESLRERRRTGERIRGSRRGGILEKSSNLRVGAGDLPRRNDRETWDIEAESPWTGYAS